MGEEQVFLTQSSQSARRVRGEKSGMFGVSESNTMLPQNYVSVKENVSGADAWG